MVTTHDIEANGTKYVLEWTHDEDGNSIISITEACANPDDHSMHMHEIYDFKEVF